MWEEKFANNAERMENNFTRGNQRCGFYDENQLPHGGPSDDRKRRDAEFDRYDRVNPCKGMKQLITGFSKWSERYISSCSGQKNYQHQANRMQKWGDIMNTVLQCDQTYTFVTPDWWWAVETGVSYEVSSKCNDDFADIDGDDCTRYAESGWCNYSAQFQVKYGINNADGFFETGLNCRACGCGADGAETLHERNESDNRKPSEDAVSKQ